MGKSNWLQKYTKVTLPQKDTIWTLKFEVKEIFGFPFVVHCLTLPFFSFLLSSFNFQINNPTGYPNHPTADVLSTIITNFPNFPRPWPKTPLSPNFPHLKKGTSVFPNCERLYGPWWQLQPTHDTLTHGTSTHTHTWHTHSWHIHTHTCTTLIHTWHIHTHTWHTHTMHSHTHGTLTQHTHSYMAHSHMTHSHSTH